MEKWKVPLPLSINAEVPLDVICLYYKREMGLDIQVELRDDVYIISIENEYGVFTQCPVYMEVRGVGFKVPGRYSRFRHIAAIVSLILQFKHGEYCVGLEEVADAFGQRKPTEVPEIGE